MINNNQKIITTEDGSHSLFLEEIDESYHSTHGAIQESRHIFILNALSEISKSKISILEMGFGTGLNAALALAYAQEHHKEITYTTIEKFPLSTEIYSQLNYAEKCRISEPQFQELHSSKWGEWQNIDSSFKLLKVHGNMEEWEEALAYDIIFFDAFSPDKQPELWNEGVFEHMYNSAKDGAILTTYCAKGAVRRTMQKAGFRVERLKGPPGKREILRAKKVKPLE